MEKSFEWFTSQREWRIKFSEAHEAFSLIESSEQPGNAFTLQNEIIIH